MTGNLWLEFDLLFKNVSVARIAPPEFDAISFGRPSRRLDLQDVKCIHAEKMSARVHQLAETR
jgi:hypothetical protein